MGFVGKTSLLGIELWKPWYGKYNELGHFSPNYVWNLILLAIWLLLSGLFGVFKIYLFLLHLSPVFYAFSFNTSFNMNLIFSSHLPYIRTLQSWPLHKQSFLLPTFHPYNIPNFTDLIFPSALLSALLSQLRFTVLHSITHYMTS